MPSDDLASFDVSYLETLTQLEADRRAIAVLSERAALRRAREAEIFARVTSDYDARVKAIAEQAEPVRRRLRDDLQKLQNLYEAYEKALNVARGQLQECEFRHEIGEFTAEQFQSCQQAAERSISERMTDLENAGKLRQRYLDLLPAEPPPAPPVQAVPAPVAAHATPVASVAPDVSATPMAIPSTPRAPAPASVPAPAQAPAKEKEKEKPAETAPRADDHTIFRPAPSVAEFKVPSGGAGEGEGDAFRTMVASAAFLIEKRDGVPGTQHRLGLSTSIGRTADNQIVVPAKEVSRRHAQITMVDGGYLLKDLNSPNGTMVNGERIVEHRLRDGDTIVLGGTTFIFKAP